MKYRKKPVVIEAIRFKGKKHSNELVMFVGHYLVDKNDEFYIETLEGEMHVAQGDFVIKGIKGEFYPCKPDIFEATYERVE